MTTLCLHSTPVKALLCPACSTLTWWEYINLWSLCIVMDVWEEMGFE